MTLRQASPLLVKMKLPIPQFIVCISILAAFFAHAQQPTAYIPASPAQSPTSPQCTPPPGATCTLSNQTSTSSPPHFLPTYPATLRLPPAIIPSILPLLSSLTSSWALSPSYTLLTTALYSLAPPTAKSSLLSSGYNFQSVVSSDWYASVPEKWKDEIEKEVVVLQRAFDGLTGNKESAGNKGYGGGRRGVDWEVSVWVLVLFGWIAGVGLL